MKSNPSHVKRLHILLTLLCQILISLVLITEKGTFGPVSMTGGVATANEGLSPGRFGLHPLELAHEIVLFSRVNYSSVCKCFGGNKTSALIQGHEDVLADSTLKRSSHISFHQIPI